MAMDDNIDDTHRTNTVNFEDPERRVRYFIGVNAKEAIQLRDSGGDSMSLFRKVMKDAGCCESQIYQKFYTTYSFVATLTAHEAKKLSDLDSVRGVKPDKKLCIDNSIHYRQDC